MVIVRTNLEYLEVDRILEKVFPNVVKENYFNKLELKLSSLISYISENLTI